MLEESPLDGSVNPIIEQNKFCINGKGIQMRSSYTTQLFSILSTIIIVFSQSADSKTISIPKDAESVQEAVELAVSGDEIVVSATSVHWTRRTQSPYYSSPFLQSDSKGVIIINKDISIIGKPGEGKTRIQSSYASSHNDTNTMLFVKNSTVTIQNCRIEQPLKSRYVGGINGGPVASPLYIESGQLRIIDCVFGCWIECKSNLFIDRSTIYGYAWLTGYVYILQNLQNPTIQFGPSKNGTLEILNSTIGSNTHDGYRNIIIENTEESKLILVNSAFSGGTFNVGYGSYPGANIVGTDAIAIDNSQILDLSIDGCYLQGGQGYDCAWHRFSIIEGGGNGGSGLSINNSDVNITFNNNLSSFSGGCGGCGFAIKDPYMMYPGISYEPFIIDGGDGGHGISIINSTVHVSSNTGQPSFQAYGGHGGAGAQNEDAIAQIGDNGLPISIDENSTFETTTPIQDWMVF